MRITWFLFYLLVVSVLVFLISAAERERVYVDEKRGTDGTYCGGHFSPCKTLNKGVKQTRNGGTVYINSTQFVRTTINIYKNITVHALHGASIVHTKDVRRPFHIFTVFDRVNATFLSLNIPLLPLVKVMSSSAISILNCSFIGREGKRIYTFDYWSMIWITMSRSRNAIVSVTMKGVIFKNTFNPLHLHRSRILSSLSILDSSFNNTGKITAYCSNAVLLRTKFCKTDHILIQVDKSVAIRQCQFIAIKSLGLSERRSTGYWKLPVARAYISNSQFQRLKVGLSFRSFSSITLFQCVVFNCITEKSLLIDIQATDIIVDKLLCNHNKAERGGCMTVRRFRSLSVKRSAFNKNKAIKKGGALNIYCTGANKPVDKLTEETVLVEINNCSFSANKAKEGGALNILNKKMKKILNGFVTNSKFAGNSASTGGSMFVESDTPTDIMNFHNCTFVNNSANSFGGVMAVYEISVKVTESIIKNNSALSGASGIDIFAKSNVSMILSQTSVIQNKPPTINVVAARIYLVDMLLTAIDHTADIHMRLQGQSIIMKNLKTNMEYSQPTRSNQIQNVIVAKASTGLQILDGFDITCAQHFNAKVSFVNSSNEKLKIRVRCEACPPNMYTVENKFARPYLAYPLPELNSGCLPCPPGAVCDGDIKVLDNHWAVNVGDKLTVLPCPHAYCCSSQGNPCVNYDTCGQGRTGILCGTCDEQHTQSFMSNECVRKVSQCEPIAYYGYFIISSLIYSFALTFLPQIVEGLKKIISRIKKSEEQVEDTNSDSGDVPLSAVVTIVIFFFQLAAVVHIEVVKVNESEQKYDNSGRMNQILFDIAAFRVSIYQELCPQDNGTLVTKMMMDMALKMNMLVNVFWFFILHSLFSFIVCRTKRKSQTSLIEDMSSEMVTLEHESPVNQDQLGIEILDANKDDQLSFNSVLKIGFIKLFKLNFTSSATILLALIHCEKIAGRPHLYVYGDHLCYVWWQYVILGLVLPTLALFPLSFGMGLDLLRKQFISTNTLLFSFVCPIAPFWVYLKSRFSKVEKRQFHKDEQRCVKEIMELEEELFEPESKGLRWPVVQLYRNLALVLLSTFILNTVFKSLCFSALFAAFYVHDRDRKPFKNSFLNDLQRLTSACLFLVNLCNNPSCFSSVGDILAVPNMDICLTCLQYLEKLLYVVVLLSFPIWKVWEKIQSVIPKCN